eukprot:243869-Pelagomonas_calceolata.AAC.1
MDFHANKLLWLRHKAAWAKLDATHPEGCTAEGNNAGKSRRDTLPRCAAKDAHSTVTRRLKLESASTHGKTQSLITWQNTKWLRFELKQRGQEMTSILNNYFTNLHSYASRSQ